MHVVVGTAGHIDHGKSALVRALTGTDPDRLKEEKERGMTTDLGFAFLGEDVTVIDVPGHEKFVRHMLAGASSIDLVVLVVAADDSVMPQTREHFEICRLMGIRKGLVAVNKVDLVDPETLELVKLEVQDLARGSFLEGAPVLAVSAQTGQGVDDLRAAILALARAVEPKPERGVFRMPVDRSFTMKGFGTVVAGTVSSGRARVGERLVLLPQGREVKVRGIQRHNHAVEAAGLGERAALNLQGLEREAVVRGNVLASPGYFSPSQDFNARMYLLKEAPRPMRNLTRVKLHVGTAEVMCRVMLLDAKELAPGEEALVQCRTEEPVVCDRDDHFVIRTFAPQQTIGGGVVLEPNPGREKRFDKGAVSRLDALRAGEAGSVLEQYLVKNRFEARTVAQAARDLALSETDAGVMLEGLLQAATVRSFRVEARDYVVHSAAFGAAREALLGALAAFHKENPHRLGLKRPELRAKAGLPVPLFEAVLAELAGEQAAAVEEDRVRLSGHQVRLGPAEQREFDRVTALYEQAGLAAPALSESLAGVEKRLAERVRTALLETGRIVDVGEGVVLHRDTLKTVEATLLRLFSRKSELTASEIRQELGTTRRYLIPLLNWFDSRGLTQRRGEVRVLKNADSRKGGQ